MTQSTDVVPDLPPDDLAVATPGWDERTPALDEEGIAALIHADPPLTRPVLEALGLVESAAHEQERR